MDEITVGTVVYKKWNIDGAGTVQQIRKGKSVEYYCEFGSCHAWFDREDLYTEAERKAKYARIAAGESRYA